MIEPRRQCEVVNTTTAAQCNTEKVGDCAECGANVCGLHVGTFQLAACTDSRGENVLPHMHILELNGACMHFDLGGLLS